MKRMAAIVTIACALSGCASTTLVSNTGTSEALKSKHGSAYKEVLLLPPKEDGRGVTPKVVQEFERLGLKVTLLDPSKPIDAPQGTGFVIDAAGYLLTCAHVVGEHKDATVTLGTQRLVADVVKTDTKTDVALLKLREPLPAGTPVLQFRSPTATTVLGEEVATLGYPLSRMLGNGVRMTRGILSAQTGLRDDANQVQVSAEIQPGNSGGPLLDHDGRVIGMVSATLNPTAVTRATGGAIPQNVNFAIRTQPIVDLVSSADGKLATTIIAKSPPPSSNALVGLEKGVAKIQAGIVGPDADRSDKLLVSFSYSSIWDIWFKFRSFVMIVVDYDTQEALYGAGQTRMNPIGTEEAVIHETVDKLGKALAVR